MVHVSLRVGQDIRLSVQDALTHGELQGSILQLGKRQLMLAFPQYRDLPGVMAGANAVLSVWDGFGLHQGRSRMLVVTTKPYPGAIIERPRTFITQQKRGYFRINTSLAITFAPLVGAAEAPALRAVTEDISAGGLRFRTVEPLVMGANLRLGVDFPLGDQATSHELVAIDGRVVRVTEVKVDDEAQYTVSCQFERVREVERDRLVKLLLDLQRRAR
jgi:PilZ domain